MFPGAGAVWNIDLSHTSNSREIDTTGMFFRASRLCAASKVLIFGALHSTRVALSHDNPWG